MNEKSLFLYLKNKQYDKFIKSLDNTLDLNVQDENGIYLIQYIILFNSIDCLNAILKYEIVIDFIDNEGKTILYTPIKYGFTEIIDILINYDKNKVGSFILETKDINNILPIHYTLKFKNKILFEHLLQQVKHSVLDIDGNTILHLCIKTKMIEFIDVYFKYVKLNLVDSINYNGETAMHTACFYELDEIIEKLLLIGCNLNIKEKNNGFTPLHILVLNGNTEYIIKFLETKQIDIESYDNYGNTILHLAILESNYEIINYIVNNYSNINYNLVNLDGNTYLHLILSKIADGDSADKYNVKLFLEKTILNIQNNEGVTPWHIIAKLGLFTTFKDTLKKTNNNIFINDKNNITPFALTKKDTIQNLVDIVSESYFNILSNGDWTLDWENDCKKASNDKDKKQCIDKIKHVILDEHKSIPLKKTNYNIVIEDPKYTNFTTFTGISFDVLLSYIYLMKKYSNNLFSSITENFYDNINVYKYYNKLGVIKDLDNEYLNFEIFWIFQQLILPTNLQQTIEDFIKSNKTIMAIPIAIELEIGAHANLIIIDKINMTIERFEPNGKTEPNNYNYNGKLLDNLLKMFFEKYFKYTYYTPIDTQPTIGFQSLEVNETDKHKKIGDPGGFCVVWCVWYLEQRLKYNVKPEKIATKLIIHIRSHNISFKKLIRYYSTNILDVRNNIMNQLQIDINDIRNNILSSKQKQDLKQLIKHELLDI